MKLILIFAGHLCVLLGVLGIFLPVLPTTPFFLLAAFFYSRGSSRFHNWLIEHKKFGPYIKNWSEHRIIPLKAKILATLLLSLNMSYPVIFVEMSILLKIIAIITACLIVIFLWSCPSKIP